MNGLKEAFSRENLLKNLNFFALLNLGLVLTAVGIVYFKNPNHFAFGGTSGLSILLADLFPHINVGGFMWIINLVLVVLGFIFLGIKCMGWTIYSSFALSFFVSCCEWLYPSGVSLSGDAMLDLVFAVFLPALGAAIVFDIGASTGGTDIVALCWPPPSGSAWAPACTVSLASLASLLWWTVPLKTSACARCAPL